MFQMSRKGRGPGRSKTGKDSAERSVQAYHTMNRFLGAFLDHVSWLHFHCCCEPYYLLFY